MRLMLVAAGVAGLLGGAAVAHAGEAADGPAQVVRLTLKDHRFEPSTVTVAAGQPIRIELSNQDGASEEFDSEDLQVEQDVTPHGRVSFRVGPLKPGAYGFMGELHADTASGQLIAVPQP